MLETQAVVIDHAIIPIRDLHSAAQSRIDVSSRAEANGIVNNVDVGLWKTQDPGEQESILAKQLYKLIFSLQQHDIPVTFLLFPRIINDPEYLFNKIRFLKPGMAYEQFLAAFIAISKPELVHNFTVSKPVHEYQPGPQPLPDKDPGSQPSPETEIGSAMTTQMNLSQFDTRTQTSSSTIFRLNKILAKFQPWQLILKFLETRSQLELIKSSPLFQAGWYIANNPDVAAARMDPATHFLKYGGLEGRNPGPNFNCKKYLENYPDVSTAKVNPLAHYLLHGNKENRSLE